MKIRELMSSLKTSYQDAQGKSYEANQAIFVEMGWAIRRLLDDRTLSYYDDFNQPEIKAMIYDEMDWDKANNFFATN